MPADGSNVFKKSLSGGGLGWTARRVEGHGRRDLK